MDENRVAELWNKAVEEVGDATYPKIIARFAALVASEEREECAMLCEVLAEGNGSGLMFKVTRSAQEGCAEAIRMRSNARVDRPDAALSRQVRSDDGLCGSGDK